MGTTHSKIIIANYAMFQSLGCPGIAFQYTHSAVFFHSENPFLIDLATDLRYPSGRDLYT
jgi:hypothetical protein